MRKDVAAVRKKIDTVNKELKPLGHTCQKKVKLYQYRILNMLLLIGMRNVKQNHWIWVYNLSQEKEYKEALEAFNDKNKEKVQLITKLMEVSIITLKAYESLYEQILGLVLINRHFADVWSFKQLVGESERLRMKKLEELSKNIDSLQWNSLLLITD